MSAEPLGRKIALSAAVMIAGRFAVRCISIVSTLILARLLMPADFGLVALASAAFVVADLLTMTAYGLVIVRKKDVTRSDYDTAWTMNLIRSGLLGGLVALSAHWQAELLGDERIAPLLMTIGLAVALESLQSPGLFRLQREFRFDLLVRLQVLTKFAAFLLTIVIAFATGSYWCLVLGNLLAKAITIPTGYIIAPYRPRLSLASWREFLSFSKWTLACNACLIVDLHAPTLVLGRLVGLPAVGAYNVSYQIAATPVTELAVPVRQPIYSGYAKVAHDRDRLRRQFLDGFGLLFSLLLPLTVGIAILAPEIQVVALGPNWVGTAPLIALCALFAFADSKAHFTHGVFTVLDEMGRLVATYVTMSLLRLPIIILGAVYSGAVGLLLMMVATAIMNALVWHWQAGRLLGHNLVAVGEQAWRPSIAALVMYVAVTLLRDALPATSPDVVGALMRTVMLVAPGAVVHVTTQLLLWWIQGRPPGAEQRLLSLFTSGLQRLRNRFVTA
ncbi:oligosaccharide flippase family protein [Sabulicella rubraurantiaca]|uniref:oligosaccharide flippase family protein n=1 Tax=Sabulicella rubraurantiaca TaxID=2811429 RepID=UPI001A97926B|nr:oligosaccharide flippase family protein [Sabulicella rubraurantiaca]